MFKSRLKILYALNRHTCIFFSEDEMELFALSDFFRILKYVKKKRQEKIRKLTSRFFLRNIVTFSEQYSQPHILSIAADI